MNNHKIFFVGLGKLGLSLAAILSKKHQVLGFDINKKLIQDLNSRNFSSVEDDVQDFLKKNKCNLNYTSEIDFKNLNHLKSIYILIPTNSSINGEYSYKNLLSLINLIIKKIKLNKTLIKKKILINICSTLQPGTYKKFLKPLEQKNNFLNFTYVPEFVACGTTIKDFINPDQLVVGANNLNAGKEILNQYLKVIKTKKINNLSIEGCEMVKLCTNSIVCNKISLANLIGEICYNNNVKDISNVLKSIGDDSRIGNKFFKVGPPFGGLCFPKDVKAFKKLCQKSNVNIGLINAVQKINNDKETFIIKRINKIIRDNKLNRIGVIGFTFKENTKVSEGSQYEKILNGIKIKNINIYDKNINFLDLTNRFKKETSLKRLFNKNKFIFIFHNIEKYFKYTKKYNKNIFYSIWSNANKNINDLNINS